MSNVFGTDKSEMKRDRKPKTSSEHHDQNPIWNLEHFARSFFTYLQMNVKSVLYMDNWFDNNMPYIDFEN